MSGDMTRVFVADARRRWSEEEKQAIIEESKRSPVARVAKKHGVATSLLFRWRKQQGIAGVPGRRPLQMMEQSSFVRVALPVSAMPAADGSGGSIEVMLASGAKLVVNERSDLALLKRVIAVLS